MFPDLSNDFRQYSIVITDRNVDQNNKNKTHDVINHHFSLTMTKKFGCIHQMLTWFILDCAELITYFVI